LLCVDESMALFLWVTRRIASVPNINRTLPDLHTNATTKLPYRGAV
jgi:hypothetical protein